MRNRLAEVGLSANTIQSQSSFSSAFATLALESFTESEGRAKVSGSSVDAISWAIKRGTTTRSVTQGPGGLGLYLLTEFVKLNGGSLRILANDAYYSTAGAVPDIRTLPVAYPGTLFQVRLNVRDDVHYTFGAT